MRFNNPYAIFNSQCTVNLEQLKKRLTTHHTALVSSVFHLFKLEQQGEQFKRPMYTLFDLFNVWLVQNSNENSSTTMYILFDLFNVWLLQNSNENSSTTIVHDVWLVQGLWTQHNNKPDLTIHAYVYLASLLRRRECSSVLTKDENIFEFNTRVAKE